MPTDANGVPFDMSHIYASGNLAADMYANVTAESSGRVLATRLYELTEDPGMKDTLSFLIARDTMHQQGWLAVIEELGGPQALPTPNSFPQDEETSEFSYVYLSARVDGAPVPEGRWTDGPSIDGRGTFSHVQARPLREEPQLSIPGEPALVQTEQRAGGPASSPRAAARTGPSSWAVA